MKILHLSPDMGFNDGRSYYVFLLLKYLKRNGHEVYLFTNSKDAEEKVKQIGIEFYCIDYFSEKSKMMSSVSVLTDFVRQKNIDLIHSHHRYYELLANTVRRKTKIKTVFTALSFVDRRYFVEYKSDSLIAVSNPVKDMMIDKFGVNKNRIKVIPNFTDTEELEHKSSGNEFTDLMLKKKKEGYKILLSVGRFHKDKDHFTLLKALTQLRKKKIYTLLIGNGDLKKDYQKFINENDLDVELIPAQKDLGLFYEHADICVLCSVIEPLPGFMLQSGLYKKPFIGSDVSGVTEVILNYENGLIFKMGKYTELKDRIMMLSESSSLSSKLSDNLHSLVMKDFTEKKIIPQIEDLYSSLKEKA